MTQSPPSGAERASVRLLEQFGPHVIDELRTRLPTFRPQLLAQGRVLGDDLVRVDAVSCVAALEVAIRLCENAGKVAARRIARAKAVALAGTICTTVSSAAIFTVVAVDAPKVAAYAAAILAVGGSVSTLIANHFAKGRGGDVQDAFLELNGSSFELMRVHCRLSRRLQVPAWDERIESDVAATVSVAQSLCDKVQRAAAVVGLSVLDQAAQAEIASGFPSELNLFPKPARTGHAALKPQDPVDDGLAPHAPTAP